MWIIDRIKDIGSAFWWYRGGRKMVALIYCCANVPFGCMSTQIWHLCLFFINFFHQACAILQWSLRFENKWFCFQNFTKSWRHQMHIFVDIFTCPAGSSCVCWPSSCCPWCSRCWSGPACPSRPRSAWSPARPCSRRCCPGPKWRGLQELDIGRGWQTRQDVADV